MNRAFIKGILGEHATKEIIDEIMAENGKDIELEKGKTTDLQNQVTNLTKTIGERDTQLEGIKNSPDNPDTLKATITTLQSENKTAKETYEKELQKVKIDNAIASALKDSKSKNAKAVQALLDLEEDITLNDDGTVKGLDEKIKSLKKSDAYLFEPETKKSTVTGAKAYENDPNDPDIDIKKKAAEMSYEDFVKAETTEN